MSTSAPRAGALPPMHYQQSEHPDAELRNGITFVMPKGMSPEDSAPRPAGTADANMSSFRQQHGYLERTASPLSRGPVFSPSTFVEASSRAGPLQAPFQHSASPPRGPVTGADRGIEHGRSAYPKGPLDFAPSASPGLMAHDRPQSSLSEESFAGRDVPRSASRPAFSNGGGGGGGGSKDPEFSIFIGDLSPDLREEDLVTQFLQPPPWPPQHPFAVAHAHAQRMQGIYQHGARVGPAPFLSTKSAKIMTDPVTGASRGYGFVRFTREADCNRALVEMQGVVVSPANGLSPGRPLRVSTTTPKSRSSPNTVPTAVDALPHPLRMPQPHHAAAEESAAYLLQHGGYGRSSVASPQPRPNPAPPQQQQQHPSMMQFASPITSNSPLKASVNDQQQQQSLAAFHAQQSGFPPPPPPLSGVDLLERTVSPPSGRAYTPASAAGSAAVSGPPKPSAMDPNNTTVFVGGLSSLISEDTLRQFFEPYGEITYVKIPPGKGCGFVQFVHKTDAERAINLMNGFPVGNARIRLSWGRSQGDKAAAAAAQAVQQASQLGHLAGLAGLSALTPSLLAQLAGLGSALSAAQANVTRSAASGHSHLNGDHTAFSNDPLSTLARQLAAANAGAATSSLGSAAYRPAQVHRPPPHSLPHQLSPSHLSIQPQSHQHQHQPQHLQHPHQQSQQHQQQHSLQHQHQHPLFPHHQPQFLDGSDRGYHPPSHHDYEALASLNPSTLQQLLAASNAPPTSEYGPPRPMPHQSQPGYPSAAAGNDLVHAFASLHFDDGAKGSAQYKTREASLQGDGGHGRGYTRDPSAFLFSPFSPADSPVGGRTELPTDGKDEQPQRPDARREADGGVEA